MKNICKNNKAVADVIPAMFALSAIIIAGLLITTIFSQPLQQSQVIETKDIKAMNLEISSLLLESTGGRTDSGTNWEDAVALASSIGLKVNTGEQAEGIPESTASTETGDPLYSNNPPNVPSNPSPTNGASGVDINTDLGWTGGDPDEGDTITYDVYFDLSTNPLNVPTSSGVTDSDYVLGTLLENTGYHWKIIASDGEETNSSPVWTFTTGSAGNNIPDIPTLSGDSPGYHKVSYTFEAQAADDDGDDVQYGFDWGDGSGVTWTGFVASDTKTGASHIWTVPNTYNVKVKAKDEHGASSNYSSSLQVVIQSHAPDKPSTPTYTEQLTVPKPISVPNELAVVDDYETPQFGDDLPGEMSDISVYIFYTSAIDVDGDMVQYRFNWDDGTGYSGWTDLVASGAEGACAHSVNIFTCYSITAQARDEYLVESVWSDPLDISPDPVCGDGICNGDETCGSCPEDCDCCDLAYCGDGSCNCGESCSSCEDDCGDCSSGTYCGDGICNGAETYTSCPADCNDPCAGHYCGDGVCDCGETTSSCCTDCCSGGCPSCCCFPAGTLISMVDGTFKPIEDVDVGEFVLSYDTVAGIFVDNVVKEIISPVRDGVYNINDGLISPTDDHPFYTKKADGRVGWASIDPSKSEMGYDFIPMQLEVGDEIFSSDGDWIKIETMEYQEGPIQTYNLKDVSSESNFFANTILVHNGSGSCSCTYRCNDGGSCPGHEVRYKCGCECRKNSGCGCYTCFSAGTNITMVDGSYKNIEDVVKGDIVVSYDFDDKLFSTDLVVNTIEKIRSGVYDINDGLVSTTGDHPLYVRKSDGTSVWASINPSNSEIGYNFIPMQLEVGDELFTDGGWVKIYSIEYRSGPFEVYTFDTKNLHNFLANSVVSHNGGTYVQGGYDEGTGTTQNSVSEYSSVLSINKINALKAIDYYWLKEEVFNLPENVHFEVKIQSLDGIETLLTYGPPPSEVSSSGASIAASNQENVVITDSYGFVFGTFQIVTYQI